MEAGLLSYLLVSSRWQLGLPGMLGGVAHALLFPTVVARGSSAFPNRYRGLGTSMMLAMLDLGTLTGAPLIRNRHSLQQTGRAGSLSDDDLDHRGAAGSDRAVLRFCPTSNPRSCVGSAIRRWQKSPTKSQAATKVGLMFWADFAAHAAWLRSEVNECHVLRQF